MHAIAQSFEDYRLRNFGKYFYRSGVITEILMSYRFSFLGIVIFLGCSSAPETIVPKFNPTAAATKALELYDTNKNGTIEGTELDKAPGLKVALARIDTNRDQALSKDEIAARVSTYLKDGVAMQPVNMNIQLDGKPLENAVVTLVPEPFLDPPLKRGTGTTDYAGNVAPKVDGLSIAAVYLGLYRVELVGKSSQGQDLPAKFNSETTLGLEVALDVPDFERGIQFAITSR